MAHSYVPERGDIVWINFNPQTGHEQSGHRPAIVISPRSYNRRVGLALFCPITSSIKGYPFEVIVPPGHTAKGAVLADQIKSFDWRTRMVRKIESASNELVGEIVGRIMTLIDPEAR